MCTKGERCDRGEALLAQLHRCYGYGVEGAIRGRSERLLAFAEAWYQLAIHEEEQEVWEWPQPGCIPVALRAKL